MKLVILFTILLSQTSFATTCTLYEIKGVFHFKEQDVVLVANEGTKSEMRFKLKTEVIYKAAPYKDITSQGTYVLGSAPQKSGAVLIEKIEKIERSFPNPLVPMEHSFVKELKQVPCPK